MNQLSVGSIAQPKNRRKPLPPVEFFTDRLDYNPETGILTWKERPREHFETDQQWRHWNSAQAGKEAGCIRRNEEKTPTCIGLLFSGVGEYKAHHVIYAMLQIHVPDHLEIDHRDGNPLNNKLENLRVATPAQNCFNKKERKDKKNGLPVGVKRHNKTRFMAYITFEKKFTNLGSFLTIEEASEARKNAELKLASEWVRQK
jgi:hypothetical protein